jgi:hypothetical protein
MHLARLSQQRHPVQEKRQYPDQKIIDRLHVGHLGLGTLTSCPAAAYVSASSRQAHTMVTVGALISIHRPSGGASPSRVTRRQRLSIVLPLHEQCASPNSRSS